MTWLLDTAVPNREPLLATPGACEAAQHSSSGPRWWLGPITFPLENHSFWIPQMPAGCQGGGVGHDAVGSSSCRGWPNLLCLHILPGSLARLATGRRSTILPSLYTAGQNQRQYVYTFRRRFTPPAWCLQMKSTVSVGVEKYKVMQLSGKGDRVRLPKTRSLIAVSSFLCLWKP